MKITLIVSTSSGRLTGDKERGHAGCRRLDTKMARGTPQDLSAAKQIKNVENEEFDSNYCYWTFKNV